MQCLALLAYVVKVCMRLTGELHTQVNEEE